MKQKNLIRIFIRKSPIFLGIFVSLFFLYPGVFASADLASSQPKILNSINTENTLSLLNALSNASFISRLSVPINASDSVPVKTPENNISITMPTLPTLPLLKIKPVNFSLMGDSIIGIGNYVSSDYNTYILQPVVDLETNTLAMIGNGIFSGERFIASASLPTIDLSQISLPKIAVKPLNTNILANAINFNTKDTINSVTKGTNEVANAFSSGILHVFSVSYNAYLSLFTPLFRNATVTPTIVEPIPAVASAPVTTTATTDSSISPAEAALAANTVVDCGTSIAPKLDTPATYENNATLSCLAQSAINCQNAKGTLTDDFFPTVFEVSNAQSFCTYKLSYPADSTLSDNSGEKLANQSLTCPVNIVKGMDDSNPSAVKFLDPDKTDLGKYGSEMYFYGTLGLFIQNNLDKNKISIP